MQSIPEVLRLMPGLNGVRNGSADWASSASASDRAFNHHDLIVPTGVQTAAYVQLTMRS